MRKLVQSTVIASFIIIADYITKRIIETRIPLHDQINVLPFLNIVHVENKGAAFGMFAGLGNEIFIVVSFVAILLIIIYLSKSTRRVEVCALSLILGGAAGNLLDRILIGKVVDFIDVFVGEWHWPAFNVADSALTVGISIFVVSSLLYAKDTKDEGPLK
jgi:signal peptidase II